LRTRLALVLATFFGTGYVPIAPGTAGTAAAIPLWFLLRDARWELQALAALAAIGAGTWAAQLAGRHYGVVDSGHIVVDEVAGLLVTTLGVPFRWETVLAAFLLFRVFDIVKPWPARYFDREVHNGFGVVMDDVAAGAYARGCMWALAAAFPAVFGWD